MAWRARKALENANGRFPGWVMEEEIAILRTVLGEERSAPLLRSLIEEDTDVIYAPGQLEDGWPTLRTPPLDGCPTQPVVGCVGERGSRTTAFLKSLFRDQSFTHSSKDGLSGAPIVYRVAKGLCGPPANPQSRFGYFHGEYILTRNYSQCKLTLRRSFRSFPIRNQLELSRVFLIF